MRVDLRPILYAGQNRLVCKHLVLLNEFTDGFNQLLAKLGQVLLFMHRQQALLVNVPMFRA